MTKQGWAITGMAVAEKTGLVVIWVAFTSDDHQAVTDVYDRLYSAHNGCKDDPIGLKAVGSAIDIGEYTVNYSMSKTIVSFGS